MKFITKMFVVPMLVISLVTGCGSSSGLSLSALTNLLNLFIAQNPTAMNAAKTVNLNNLTTVLNNLANTSGVSASQAAILTSPAHQEVLRGILQLAAGGGTAKELSGVSSILAGASTGSGLVGIVDELISVFDAIAPVIENVRSRLRGDH